MVVNTRSQVKAEEYPQDEKEEEKRETKDIRERDMTKQLHTGKMRHGKFSRLCKESKVVIQHQNL
jgi:hypothetical protein